jgi:hypothetical protein
MKVTVNVRVQYVTCITMAVSAVSSTKIVAVYALSVTTLNLIAPVFVADGLIKMLTVTVWRSGDFSFQRAVLKIIRVFIVCFVGNVTRIHCAHVPAVTNIVVMKASVGLLLMIVVVTLAQDAMCGMELMFVFSLTGQLP